MRFTIQDVRAEVLPDNSASLGGAVAATQETVEEIGEWIRAKPDEEKRPWWARLWGK